MSADNEVRRVLRVFPEDCQALAVTAVESTTSFSGARLWRIETQRGPLCLRSWQGHPSPERLEFIQAVLWHVDQEGFHRIPLPIETQHHHGYVRHAGLFWELSPWLPGEPNFGLEASPARVAAAMTALAEFHETARLFPLDATSAVASPGILERGHKLRQLVAGGIDELAVAMTAKAELWPELAARGERTLAIFARLAPLVLAQLTAAAGLPVAIQPCIRDVWKAHVLFAGDDVTGIVDFSAMRPENVAADVARLLGSLAGDNRPLGAAGLRAYELVRRLSDEERQLVGAFNISGVLLSPLQWLGWIFLEQRQFARPDAVLARYDELIGRMENLALA